MILRRPLLYLIPLLLLGCAKKPAIPPELVGNWDHTEDMGFGVKSSQRLALKANGHFKITESGSGSGSPLTGGPSGPEGETVESGTYWAGNGTLHFSPTSVWVGGVDVGALSDYHSKNAYQIQGATLTLESKGLMLARTASPAGATGGAPPAATGTITLTRVP